MHAKMQLFDMLADIKSKNIIMLTFPIFYHVNMLTLISTCARVNLEFVGESSPVNKNAAWVHSTILSRR